MKHSILGNDSDLSLPGFKRERAMNDADFNRQTAAYHKRADIERIDAATVDEAALKAFAERAFDSWCASTLGKCGCAYCRARRALDERSEQ